MNAITCILENGSLVLIWLVSVTKIEFFKNDTYRDGKKKSKSYIHGYVFLKKKKMQFCWFTAKSHLLISKDTYNCFTP